MKKEIKRMWLLTVLTIAVLVSFITGWYEVLPNAIQVVALKTLLVTAGLILAHLVRKALFPPIDWSNDRNWQLSVAVISLYISIPYCFAMGG